MSFPLDLESYNVQQDECWPCKGRVILSQCIDETIIVYQTTEHQTRAGKHDYMNVRDVLTDTRVEDPNKVANDNKSKDETDTGEDFCNDTLNNSVRLETSFVRAMHNCGWGKSSGYERVYATLLTKDGFEEILRCYVNDVKNQNPTGDVSVEWSADRSLKGDVLDRFVPEITIRGKTLQQFCNTWTVSVKDISKYVDRQRRLVESGFLQRTWTPREIVYISELSEQCTTLDLENYILNDNVDNNGVESGVDDDIDDDNQLDSSEFLTIADSSELWKQVSDSREAILYLYGAFNPIHLGHVNALLESKRWLETKGMYNVCATKIALASDLNIKHKNAKSGDLCIKFEHRLKLCELACRGHNYIEVMSTPFNSQSLVGEKTRKELNKPEATLVPLMGSDRAFLTKRRLTNYRRENKFVLCVGRKGMSTTERKKYEEAEKIRPTNSYDFFVVPTEFNEISSTKVRKKLSEINGNNSRKKSTKKSRILMKELIELGWLTESEGEYIMEHIDTMFF